MSLQIGSPPKRFQSTWDTTQAGSSNNQVVLPLESAGSYNFRVDWGDGTSNRDTITAYDQAEVTHTYDSTGVYEIRIVRGITGWAFNNGGDKLKISSISKWGPFTVRNNSAGNFQGCTNLVVSTDDELYINAGTYGATTFFANCTNLGGPTNIRIGPTTNRVNSLFSSCHNWDEDLSDLDVSNVIEWLYMFNNARTFNNGGSTGINDWDVSNTPNGAYIFQMASGFNQPIGSWDTSNWTSLYRMFYGDGLTMSFNQPIGSWDMSNVTNMTSSFSFCKFFDQDIGSWDTSSVTRLQGMFYFATGFNNGGQTGINNWDTSNVTTFESVFSIANNFNQPVGSWDTSKATNMVGTFSNARAFNQDLSNWNTSGVTDMYGTFQRARAFNNGGQTGINNWDTSSCTRMDYMFYDSVFNQPIGAWDTSNVTNMRFMFADDGNGGDFNQDISSWQTSGVTNMSNMFSRATVFNQPIGSWNTSSLTNIESMLFVASAFDQDLSNWIVTGITNATNFMNAKSISTTNYDRILSGWSPQSVQNGVNIHFGSSNYSTATGAAYRATLVSKGWTITDGGAV